MLTPISGGMSAESSKALDASPSRLASAGGFGSAGALDSVVGRAGDGESSLEIVLEMASVVASETRAEIGAEIAAEMASETGAETAPAHGCKSSGGSHSTVERSSWCRSRAMHSPTCSCAIGADHEDGAADAARRPGAEEEAEAGRRVRGSAWFDAAHDLDAGVGAAQRGGGGADERVSKEALVGAGGGRRPPQLEARGLRLQEGSEGGLGQTRGGVLHGTRTRSERSRRCASCRHAPPPTRSEGEGGGAEAAGWGRTACRAWRCRRRSRYRSSRRPRLCGEVRVGVSVSIERVRGRRKGARARGREGEGCRVVFGEVRIRKRVGDGDRVWACARRAR